MDHEVAKLWVAALRSGKYDQGKEYLCKNDRFCCLGVLCEILDTPKTSHGDAKDKTLVIRYGLQGDTSQTTLPEFVRRKAGMKTPDATINDYTRWPQAEHQLGRHITSLMEWNDVGGTFPDIADWIEANADAL